MRRTANALLCAAALMAITPADVQAGDRIQVQVQFTNGVEVMPGGRSVVRITSEGSPSEDFLFPEVSGAVGAMATATYFAPIPQSPGHRVTVRFILPPNPVDFCETTTVVPNPVVTAWVVRTSDTSCTIKLFDGLV